jgi:murein DD-endopeptidase MepM/ murein hydrolase activator NlpD
VSKIGKIGLHSALISVVTVFGGLSAASLPSMHLAQDVKPRYFRQPANFLPTVNAPLQGFCHPLKGRGYLSQGIRSGTHRGRAEYAYDLAIAIGSPVYAMGQGRVIAKEDRYPDNGGGRGRKSKFNYVWVEHEDGYRSAYLHLQQGFGRKVNLSPGTPIKTGQLIGYSGNSGWSSAPHLHIEVQAPGKLSEFTKTVPFAMDSADCRANSRRMR